MPKTTKTHSNLPKSYTTRAMKSSARCTTAKSQSAMKSGRIPHSKTTLYGNTFDSKAEAQRYLELRQMLKNGEISDLVLQPEYELVPKASIPHEKAFRAHSYTADFQYVKGGKIVIEDVKSDYTRKDRTYILNRKLMWFLKKLYVREVIR